MIVASFLARTQVQAQLQEAMFRCLLLSLSLLTASQVFAQQDATLLSRILADYKIKTSVGLQLWATYSQNMQVLDAATNTYRPVDDRLNVQLRRSRFTLSGQPYPTLRFNVTAGLDLVGHDLLSGTEAGGNNGPSPLFRIWNAYLTWQLTPQRDLLYFTSGYFVSPLGRESNTSAVRSNSFEKAWSQNYLRRHLVGTGPGRAMGLLVGGQLHNAENNLHLTYELALQNPVFEAYGGNSTGAKSSPLLSGRLSAHFGDAESQTYSLSHKVNYFGKRRGLTLSLAAARQGNTDLFASSGVFGAEILFNHAAFHLDGEYFVLQRTTNTATSEGTTGYLRLGKNFALPKKLVLEPVISYWFFRGGKTIAEIEQANLLNFFSGDDTGIDMGANLYFNPDTKLSLFYAYRAGDAGQGEPQLVNNNFYQQPGVGAVKRGSYLGAGWVVVF